MGGSTNINQTKSDFIEFVKAAIKRPMEVSTIFPTSPFLADLLLSNVPFGQPGAIVEVGCGTGAITGPILARIPSPSPYLGIEISHEMVSYLRARFPQTRFEQASANQVAELTGDHKARAVISSLPWTVFPAELQDSTMSSIRRALAPSGVFVTYVCLNAAWYPKARRFSRLLRSTFARVERTPIEWRNIPPAFVYVCRTPP